MTRGVYMHDRKRAVATGKFDTLPHAGGQLRVCYDVARFIFKISPAVSLKVIEYVTHTKGTEFT